MSAMPSPWPIWSMWRRIQEATWNRLIQINGSCTGAFKIANLFHVDHSWSIVLRRLQIWIANRWIWWRWEWSSSSDGARSLSGEWCFVRLQCNVVETLPTTVCCASAKVRELVGPMRLPRITGRRKSAFSPASVSGGLRDSSPMLTGGLHRKFRLEY